LGLPSPRCPVLHFTRPRSNKKGAQPQTRRLPLSPRVLNRYHPILSNLFFLVVTVRFGNFSPPSCVRVFGLSSNSPGRRTSDEKIRGCTAAGHTPSSRVRPPQRPENCRRLPFSEPGAVSLSSNPNTIRLGTSPSDFSSLLLRSPRSLPTGFILRPPHYPSSRIFPPLANHRPFQSLLLVVQRTAIDTPSPPNHRSAPSGDFRHCLDPSAASSERLRCLPPSPDNPFPRPLDATPSSRVAANKIAETPCRIVRFFDVVQLASPSFVEETSYHLRERIQSVRDCNSGRHLRSLCPPTVLFTRRRSGKWKLPEYNMGGRASAWATSSVTLSPSPPSPSRW
jgi:hypothetical protein